MKKKIIQFEYIRKPILTPLPGNSFRVNSVSGFQIEFDIKFPLEIESAFQFAKTFVKEFQVVQLLGQQRMFAECFRNAVSHMFKFYVLLSAAYS